MESFNSTEERNKYILNQHATGVSNRQIAKNVGISHVAVAKILKQGGNQDKLPLCGGGNQVVTEEDAIEFLKNLGYLILKADDKETLIEDLIQQGLVNRKPTKELPKQIQAMKSWKGIPDKFINSLLNSILEFMDNEFTVEDFKAYSDEYPLMPDVVEGFLSSGGGGSFYCPNGKKYKKNYFSIKHA